MTEREMLKEQFKQSAKENFLKVYMDKSTWDRTLDLKTLLIKYLEYLPPIEKEMLYCSVGDNFTEEQIKTVLFADGPNEQSSWRYIFKKQNSSNPNHLGVYDTIFRKPEPCYEIKDFANYI